MTQKAIYIFQQLTQAGMTVEAACSTIAQLQAESALRPNNVEDRSGIADEIYTANVDSGYYTRFIDDAYGYGLAQWTFWSRKKKLLLYARSHSASIGDLAMQTAFLIQEMKEDYPAIWKLCTSSHDLYDLTKQLLYTWENPAEKENNLRVRFGYAQGWLSMFTSESVVVDPELKTKAVSPEIVRAVLNGEYGNGQDRIDRLSAAGYNACDVQNMINSLYDKAASLKSFIASCEGYYELVQDISGVL